MFGDDERARSRRCGRMRTRREQIASGIDPDTGLSMSHEMWHTKLILMTANSDEFAEYYHATNRGMYPTFA